MRATVSDESRNVTGYSFRGKPLNERPQVEGALKYSAYIEVLMSYRPATRPPIYLNAINIIMNLMQPLIFEHEAKKKSSTKHIV
jgi:hypothetical protein